MSIENVRRFEERVSGDEALQARLRELSDAFDGDRQDERAVFEAVVAPLAAEVGLPYTYDEALEVLTPTTDDEDLTADEVRAVAAGNWGLCAGVGFGSVQAKSCFRAGDGAGAIACAGIGVGGGFTG